MPRACLAAAFAVLYLLAPVFCSDAAARGPLRILTLGLMDTMSHHKFMSTLTVELARRGHLVTSVDVAMPKDVPATLNVSVIETAFSAWPDNLIDEWHDISAFRQILLVHQFGVLECEDLRAPTIRRLIESDLEFDLLVIDHTAECMLGFAHRFGYPGVVLVSPFPGYIDDLMGVPPLPGVLPIMSQPFPLPMGLWQRAATLVLQAWSQGCDWWYRSEQDRYLREAFGPDVPSTIELRRAVHLALINESPGAVEVARPLPPSVIPVGGLHVKPANISNIPADLLSWLEEAKTGFVFVSFGSLIKGEHVGNAKLATMAESFGALGPAVRVLWKTERLGATALPPNVRTGEWLPQNDLLGHPKMLLFVSHCGGLSTSEASHHGMPVLGVPFLADQFLNAEKLLQHGSGRYISFEGITKKLFVSEIKEMIENPK